MVVESKEDLIREIAELNAEKARVIRDINLPMIEARERADAVIKEAEERGKHIGEIARKIRVDADAYAVRTRYEATDMLNMAKKGIQEADDMASKIEQQRVDFESYKLSAESNLQQKKLEATSLMAQAVALQKELDERQIGLGTKQATLERQETDIASREVHLATLEKKLNSWEADLISKIEAFNKIDAELKNKIAEDKKMQEDISVKVESVKRDKEAIRKLSNEINNQKTINDEQIDIIKAKFAQIETTQTALEEKGKALEDKEELLEIRSKDIEDRIKVLAELRKRPQK